MHQKSGVFMGKKIALLVLPLLMTQLAAFGDRLSSDDSIIPSKDKPYS